MNSSSGKPRSLKSILLRGAMLNVGAVDPRGGNAALKLRHSHWSAENKGELTVIVRVKVTVSSTAERSK